GLGRARIGRRGDTLRRGERRKDDDKQAEGRKESLDHARDIGARAPAAQVRRHGRTPCFVFYTVKLSPQPHAPFALGFSKTNPAEKSSSTQSMTLPIK